MQCTLAGDHHPVDGPHGARERAYTQNRPTRGQRGYVDGPHSARAQHLRHGRSPGAEPITFSPSSTRKTPPVSWIYNVFPGHKRMLASDFLFPENVAGKDEPCRNFSTRPTDHPVPTWMRDLVLIFIAPALRRCWWWRLRAVFCGQLLPVTYLLVAFSTLGSGVVQADFFSRSILV